MIYRITLQQMGGAKMHPYLMCSNALGVCSFEPCCLNFFVLILKVNRRIKVTYLQLERKW